MISQDAGENLCRKFANRYRWMCGRGMLDYDDLMQVARLGLEAAKKKFVASPGGDFAGYASMVIRQRMIRAMSGMHPVHVPEKVLRREWRALDRSGAERRDVEIEDESAELWGVTPANDCASDVQRAARVLATLSEREQRVIQLRFFRDMTLLEVGKDIGRAPERVRQIELRALDKLRAALKAA